MQAVDTCKFNLASEAQFSGTGSVSAYLRCDGLSFRAEIINRHTEKDDDFDGKKPTPVPCTFDRLSVLWILYGRSKGRLWRIVLKKSANWQFGIGQCNRRIGLDCA